MLPPVEKKDAETDMTDAAISTSPQDATADTQTAPEGTTDTTPPEQSDEAKTEEATEKGGAGDNIPSPSEAKPARSPKKKRKNREKQQVMVYKLLQQNLTW